MVPGTTLVTTCCCVGVRLLYETAAAAPLSPAASAVTDRPTSGSPTATSQARRRSATAVADAGRWAGSGARHCNTSSANCAGKFGRVARGSGAGWVRRASAAAIGVSPANGSAPVIISKIISPSA